MHHLAASPGFSLGDAFTIGILLAGFALFAAVAALSLQEERAFTPAMVYLVLGALGAAGVELAGFDWIDPFEDTALIERLAEFAVIVALFSAGLKLDRALGWRRWGSTTRLLAVVMPLTIAAVALFGVTAMGLSVGAAVILGAVLAPTDPVLAGEVSVGPPGEEQEREPQFALTSEAGLNDGLAFPFVFLGVFIAGEDGAGWVLEWALADVVYAIVVGIVVGAVGGWLMARTLLGLREREMIVPGLDGWLPIAAVLALYGATETVGAYGFLAAFAGGLAFRRYEADHEYNARLHAGAEAVEKFTELALVTLLGTMVTVAGLQEPGLAGWLLVPLLLLVIRPLSVLAAFARSSVPRLERAFVGWFGIRGIGSFYYLAVVLQTGAMDARDQRVVFWTVVAVSGVSILAHGLTATPFSRRLSGPARPAAAAAPGA